MLLYLFVILLSTLGVYITRKKNLLIAILIGVLPISLFAGLRDDTVGTDIGVYLIRLWDSCQYSDFSDVLYYNEMIEIGYAVFVYLISQFTTDIHWLFFIEHFLLLSILIYTIRKYSVPYSVLLYCLFLFFTFNASLCLMRQFFAIIAVVIAFLFLLKGQINKFVVAIILGGLFHNSTLFLLSILPILHLLRRFPNKGLIIQIGIAVLGVIFYMFFPVIISFLISNGLLNEKYTRYLAQEFSTHKIDYVLSLAIYGISLMGIPQESNTKVLLKVLSIITVVLTLCGVYNDVASRVAMYIYIYSFIVVFVFVNELFGYKKKIVLFLLSTTIVVRFIYISIISDYSETIPYTSKILGIEQ